MVRGLRLGAMVGLALAAVLACGHPDVPVRPDAGTEGVDRGEAQYRRACAACHGTDGAGDGPVASSLRTAPPDLTRLAARAGGTFSRDVVVDAITGGRDYAAHGTRDMPVWGTRFEPTGEGATTAAALYARWRIEAIVDYVEILQRR